MPLSVSASAFEPTMYPLPLWSVKLIVLFQFFRQEFVPSKRCQSIVRYDLQAVFLAVEKRTLLRRFLVAWTEKAVCVDDQIDTKREILSVLNPHMLNSEKKPLDVFLILSLNFAGCER